MREIMDLRRLSDMDADQAAALLAARLSDQATEQDAETLRDWLSLDQRNQTAWADIEWMLGVVATGRDDEAFQHMLDDARLAGPSTTLNWPRWTAAAAVMLLVSTVAALEIGPDLWNPNAKIAQSDAPGSARSGAMTSYHTARGERHAVTLADGSTMTLDTDSTVEVRYSPRQRSFRLLQGQAFFAVKHDVTRPFTVWAAKHAVTALGTRFDVRLDPARFRVMLVEGRVAVATPGTSARIVLDAGQQLVQRNGEPPVVSRFETEQPSDWQAGLITFHNDMLSDSVAELNRYSRDQLIVRDPALATLRISGTFRTGDVRRFARTIVKIYPIRVVPAGEHKFEIVRAR